MGSGALAVTLPNSTEAKNQPITPAAFNMCGYAAPKLSTVRIGLVGTGSRGTGAVDRLSYIEGVEITALCDKYPKHLEKSQELLQKKGLKKAKE